jgi:catechol-2,3-dioxygenase
MSKRIIYLFTATLSLLIFSGVANFFNFSTASTNALSDIHPYAVTISVPNLSATANWYSEKLGFREVQRKSYPELQTSLAFLELNDYRIELIEDGNAQPNVARPDPPQHAATYGLSQFSFLTNDLTTVRAELMQRGIPMSWSLRIQSLDCIHSSFVIMTAI